MFQMGWFNHQLDKDPLGNPINISGQNTKIAKKVIQRIHLFRDLFRGCDCECFSLDGEDPPDPREAERMKKAFMRRIHFALSFLEEDVDGNGSSSKSRSRRFVNCSVRLEICRNSQSGHGMTEG